MAAADLTDKLAAGFYIAQEGKRCRIAGDMSKLRFAEGITPMQRRLLQDFCFRTKSIPGTQDIRSKIGVPGLRGSWFPRRAASILS